MPKLTEIQKAMAAKRKEAVEEDEKRNEELYKQISESFKKAEESYYKSMDELPGGFSLIGMQVEIYFLSGSRKQVAFEIAVKNWGKMKEN